MPAAADGHRLQQGRQPQLRRDDLDRRCDLGERRAQVRGQGRRDGGSDPDADRSAVPAGDPPDRGRGSSHVVEDRRGVPEQFGAGLGERDPPGGAGE
jgi:hypothetical protein